MKINRAVLAVSVVALIMTVPGAQSAASSFSRAERDWSSFGHSDTEDHFSPLTQVNDANIGKLGLAWYYDIDTFDSYTAPLAVDGVIYFAVGLSVVHALDARTGKLLWQYDPDVASQDAAKTRMRAGWGTRGIAYQNGKIFTATRDGRLIGINAKTGKMLWSAQTLDEAENGYISGPPWVASNKVIIGFGGADYAPVRGYVTAYDIGTGKKAWRFYTVPGDPKTGFENEAMAMAAKTWTGEWWKLGGAGGTVYHAMAYDAKFNRFYIGTGNGFPWNQKIRSPGGGDNLFLGSIVALDADTGKYIWHYQANPENSYDFNNAMDIQLADLKVDGALRSVIIHAPKNGFFYVIDRTNGKLLSAGQFGKQNWAKGIDLKTGRPELNPDALYPDGKPFMIYPFPSGAHGLQAMSFNPGTGLAYIPVMEGGKVVVDPPNMANWKYKPGMFVNTGFGAPPADMVPPKPSSSLVAWDPVKQQAAWTIPQPGVFNGGTMTTAGNLVFQGLNDGNFVAYLANSGRKIWSFPAQNGILGNAITYMVGKKQYVTVLTGFRSTTANTPNWDYSQQKRRVLTFVLDGKRKLPSFKATEFPIRDDPAFIVEPAKSAHGSVIYNSSCVICHGFGMVSGGAAPDLRKSAIPMDTNAFTSVVRDGALMPRGMPRFDEFTDEDLDGIRQYIRQRARETTNTSK